MESFLKIKYFNQFIFKHVRWFSQSFLDISPEVAEALENRKPIVALESTIITHGMPYPENMNTALAVEHLVKEQGALPVTIGVLDGRVKIGLDEQSLWKLAAPVISKVKISRRDFPYVLSKGLNGGTTVSGTLLIAKMVGIKIFVTGGIGGVHRDVLDTMDISTDLFELSQTPVMVVSSGIKSILDIGKTLQYLETIGVCTVVYGDNKEFPAFYSRSSDHECVYNITSSSEAAQLLNVIDTFKLSSGILLAVPIPEKYQIDKDKIEKSIQKALKLAKEKCIQGKDVTPFILEQLNQITEGRSLQSNIGLIKHNAVIGSQIAVQYEKLSNRLQQMSSFNIIPVHQKRTFVTRNGGSPVIIGGSIMDCVAVSHEPIQVGL